MRLYSKKWLSVFSPSVAALVLTFSAVANAQNVSPVPHSEVAAAETLGAPTVTEGLLTISTQAVETETSITIGNIANRLDGWYEWLATCPASLRSQTKLSYLRLLARIPGIDAPSSIFTEDRSILSVWRNDAFHAEFEVYRERVEWILIVKQPTRTVVSSSNDGGFSRLSEEFVGALADCWNAR